MALDLSADYALIDDPVTVSYYSKTGEGAYASATSVTYCQRNPVTKDDARADPALLEKDAAVYHLWAALLGGLVPKIGDKLADAGTTWLVRSVSADDRDRNGVQRYRAVVTKSTATP
jgi:hypothetical protein